MDWTINHQLNRTRPYDVSKRCSIVAAGLWILHGWIFCSCLGSNFGALVFFSTFVFFQGFCSRITLPWNLMSRSWKIYFSRDYSLEAFLGSSPWRLGNPRGEVGRSTGEAKIGPRWTYQKKKGMTGWQNDNNNNNNNNNDNNTNNNTNNNSNSKNIMNDIVMNESSWHNHWWAMYVTFLREEWPETM